MRLPVFVRPLALGGCLSAVVDLVVAQSDPPGGEQNPFIIEDDLDSLGWWKDTQVKKGLWSQVVDATVELMGDEDEASSEEMEIKYTHAMYEWSGIGLLSLLEAEKKRTYPAMRVFTAGMRDVPNNEDFKSQLDTWVKVPAGGKLLEEEWALAQLTEVKHSPGFRASPWLMDGFELEEKYELDHYLECHFAGPILTLASGDYLKGDETFGEAISLLRLMLNHRRNLVWIPKSLNRHKVNLLTGSKLWADDPLTDILIRYLEANSSRLRNFITQIAITIDKAKPKANTNLVKMLKIIYNTPFCTGAWNKVLTIDVCKFGNNDEAYCIYIPK